MIRRHITFYGSVQGVGLRYRARHVAELYGCSVWVRNDWDGSVTMEIQEEENRYRFTGETICIDSGMTRLMIYHGEHVWTFEG